MRHRNRYRPPLIPEREFRVNQKITAPQVRVVGANGENLNILSTSQALALALEQGLDLVEVNPKSDPPTCRLVDYGKFRYQENKKSAQHKPKRIETKGIRLSAKISGGDLEIRKRQALNFLQQGNKVKIELIMRGRENAHADLCIKSIKEFIANLGETVSVEQSVIKTGNRLSAIVTLRH